MLALLYAHTVATFLIACWLGWNMFRKLDRYDWAYSKFDIWLDFCMTLLLWPVILLLSPKKLLSPTIRPSPACLNMDYANIPRQRAQFMDNPPPCGELVLYRSNDCDGNESGANFLFRAESVEATADRIAAESPGIIGMRGAARWTSLRDASIKEPTPVPEVLVNFDTITEKLIETGIGQVICPECNKIYPTTELSMEPERIAGRVFSSHFCPARHSLLTREVMRFFLKRNVD